MTDLQPTTGIYQLEESIINRLCRRNSKQLLSDNSKQTYLTAIRDFNKFLADNNLQVNTESLREYFDDAKKKLKPSTLNLRRYALLKVIKAQIGNDTLSRYAIDEAFQEVSTYSIDNGVPVDECLSEADVRKLVDSAQSKKTGLIINFLYKTACRVSESLSIRVADCKPINGHVKIDVVGKGNKQRSVYITTQLYNDIREVYSGKTWLFESKSSKKLHRDNISNQIRKAGRRAGLGNVTPHMLRHARATDLLLSKNQSLKAVSKYLGHSSTAVTASIYLHDQVDVSTIFAQDTI